MQLKFGYDLKPKVGDESGGYAFAIVFRFEILRKRRQRKKRNGRIFSRLLYYYNKRRP